MEDCTYANTPTFAIKGKYKAKVLKVLDGDSAYVCFKYNGKYYKFNARLNGIDAPETRTKNLEEKKAGLISKQYLKNIIDNKIVDIDIIHFDKYGRILVELYYNDKHINKYMVDGGYAFSYNGGTKIKYSLRHLKI